tara:strand:+ start:588 stop:767 length:180 start_codon:yes stop_codon:yes gene_type:complete
MKLTKEQINKKYKGKYVEIYPSWCHETGKQLYEVGKTSRVIRENMTLGEDVGTENEYRR